MSPIFWVIFAKLGFRVMRAGFETVQTVTSSKEPYVTQRREAKEHFKKNVVKPFLQRLRGDSLTEFIRMDLPPGKHYAFYRDVPVVLFGVEIAFVFVLIIGVLPADYLWITIVPPALSIFFLYKMCQNRARRGVRVKVWKGTKEPVENWL